MAKYFRLPFAVNGDKKDVPDTTQTTGVSYNTGYSQDYQRNPESDPLARRVERNYFNDILYQVTDTLKELYETGVPPFITSAENDGKPFPYPLRARVRLNNRIYESSTNDNVTTPPASEWVLVDSLANDDRYLNEANNLSDLPDKGNARTNLNLGTAAVLDEGKNPSDLMAVGSFGVGGGIVRFTGNLLEIPRTEFLYSSHGSTNRPVGSENGGFNNYYYNNENKLLTYHEITSNRFHVNSINNGQARGWKRVLLGPDNLEELTDTSKARTNLGLGTAAVEDVGKNEDDISTIANAGIGGYNLSDQGSGSEFPSPDDINRNGMFFYPTHSSFPQSGSWFVFSMINGGNAGDPNSGTKAQWAIRSGESVTDNYFYIRVQDNASSVWGAWRSIA